MSEATTPALPRTWRQMFAFLGGMVAYATHLMVGPPLVPVACAVGSTWPLHLLTAAVVVVVGASFYESWRIWSAVTPRGDDVYLADSAGRARLLAMLGLLLNPLALAVVVFAEVPVWVLDPCLPP